MENTGECTLKFRLYIVNACSLLMTPRQMYFLKSSDFLRSIPIDIYNLNLKTVQVKRQKKSQHPGQDNGGFLYIFFVPRFLEILDGNKRYSQSALTMLCLLHVLVLVSPFQPTSKYQYSYYQSSMSSLSACKEAACLGS